MNDSFEAMSYVHRRPNFRVHHPLLIWHLGFWNNISASEPSVAESDIAEDRAQQLRAASAYAQSLAGRVREGLSSVPDSHVGRSTFEESKYPEGRWTYCFCLGACCATIRIEWSPEFLTITSLLDFSRAKGEDCWWRCPPEITRLIRTLKEYLSKAERAAPGAHPLGREAAAELADACFADVWKAFGRDILEVGSAEFAALGEQFADFRGIMLGDRLADDEGEPSGLEGVFGHRNAAIRPFRPQTPFWHVEDSSRRDHKTAKLTDAQWRERFHVLWPLMAAPVNGKDIVDHEFTATIFEGSALQVTAMGARPTADNYSAKVPLYYGVYTSGMGGWAIGRLVSQLCDLGTFRLAATREIDNLEAASVPLREAESEAQRALDRASDSGEGGAASAEPLQEALARVHARKMDTDSKVPGGIAYRIEQSAYYAKRFQDVLGGLDVADYDDFQSYGKFVTANHGPTFGFIDMLRSRNERLMHDMRNLYQRVVAEEGRRRYNEIVKIQQTAEILSIAVLAPYYFGGMLSHIFWNSPENMSKWWWAALFGWLGAVAASRIQADDRRGRRIRFAAVSTFCLLSAIVTFFAIYYEQSAWREQVSGWWVGAVFTALGAAIAAIAPVIGKTRRRILRVVTVLLGLGTIALCIGALTLEQTGTVKHEAAPGKESRSDAKPKKGSH